MIKYVVNSLIWTLRFVKMITDLKSNQFLHSSIRSLACWPLSLWEPRTLVTRQSRKMWYLCQQDSENDVQSKPYIASSNPLKCNMSAPTTSDLHWMLNKMRMLYQIRAETCRFQSSHTRIADRTCWPEVLKKFRQDGMDFVPCDTFFLIICSELIARNGEISYKLWELMPFSFRMYFMKASPSHPHEDNFCSYCCYDRSIECKWFNDDLN